MTGIFMGLCFIANAINPEVLQEDATVALAAMLWCAIFDLLFLASSLARASK